MTLKLLRNGEVENGSDVVTLTDYLTDPQAWSNVDPGSFSVVVEPADDLSEFPAELLTAPAIYLSFPVYTDGRGYTHARTLRMHHGFSGELVAIGDIRRDQVEFMRRVGIETVEFNGRNSVAELVEALSELEMPSPHKYYSGGAQIRA